MPVPAKIDALAKLAEKLSTLTKKLKSLTEYREAAKITRAEAKALDRIAIGLDTWIDHFRQDHDLQASAAAALVNDDMDAILDAPRKGLKPPSSTRRSIKVAG